MVYITIWMCKHDDIQSSKFTDRTPWSSQNAKGSNFGPFHVKKYESQD